MVVKDIDAFLEVCILTECVQLLIDSDYSSMHPLNLLMLKKMR